jgi:hypothetical protein
MASKGSGRYVRKMSPLERYSLVIHEVYRYHVDAFVEGTGSIDAAALQAAANRAAEANPGIRVRLRGWLAGSRWVDSGIAPQVRVLPIADWNGSSEAGAPFLEEKLDPMRGGAVADILVVPCRDGLTRVIFRSVHAAVDGRGLMHWGAEVFREMRGEPLQGSPSTLTDLDVQFQHRDKVASTTPPEDEPCIPVVPPSEPPRELRYVWRRALVDNNISAQLLPKTAAFLADWARRTQKGGVRFTVPVDYRGLRTQEMSVGNLLGYLRIVVPEQASPRALMQQISQGIRDYADCRRLPGAWKLMWTPIWFMARQLRGFADYLLYATHPHLPTGGLVSMGAVDLEDYAIPGFQPTAVGGIPGAVGKLNVVFVGYPGVIAIVFSAPAAYNREGQLDELVNAYQQQFSRAEKAA